MNFVNNKAPLNETKSFYLKPYRWYEVTDITSETEKIMFVRIIFSYAFNFNDGADVYLLEREDGKRFECHPKFIESCKEVQA